MWLLRCLRRTEPAIAMLGNQLAVLEVFFDEE